MRRNLHVKIALPVHPLGDRLDDQVAAGQQVQVLLVVGRGDCPQPALLGQRRRRQLAQVLQRLGDHAVGRAVLRGQVEQHDVDVGVGQVRGDLCAHDASA